MRAYEAMFIIAPDLDDTAQQTLVERLAGVIVERGGVVDRIHPWGTRRLAYELAGQRDGAYVVVDFQAEHAAVAEFERVLRLNDSVLRHIVVRQEEPVTPLDDADAHEPATPSEPVPEAQTADREGAGAEAVAGAAVGPTEG